MMFFNKEEFAIRKVVPDSAIQLAYGRLLHRASMLVPVLRTTVRLPQYARGAYMSFKDPILNHIILSPTIDEYESLIVLAHEFGHAENFELERERWNRMSDETLVFVNKGIQPPDVFPLLEEEIKANRRGRAHLQQILPEVVPEYDRQMSMALAVLCVRLENLPLPGQSIQP